VFRHGYLPLFENSLLRRRLLHHIGCQLPSWLGSSVIVIRDCNRNLFDLTRNSVRLSLRKVESRHRPSSELVGEIVDHHMDLVLTLDNDVSFRSWHRHSCQFSYVTRWRPFEGGRMDTNCIGRGRYIIDLSLTRKLHSRWSYSPDRNALLLSESRFVHCICRSRHLLIRHSVGSRWTVSQ